MRDFIKPLAGAIVMALGISVILFGIGLLISGGNVLSTLGAFLSFVIGAEICQLGYVMTQGVNIRETFILRIFNNLNMRQ